MSCTEEQSISTPTLLLALNNELSIARAKKLRHDAFTESLLEVQAFEEDVRRMSNWPPRAYRCSFCRRLFTSAQALGGHMNVHRRDRARHFLSSASSAHASSSLTSLDNIPYSANTNLTTSSSPQRYEASMLSPCPDLDTLLSDNTSLSASTPALCLLQNPSMPHILGSSTFSKISAPKQGVSLSSPTSSSKRPPLEALPLLKERSCRCQIISTRSRTNTKATSKYPMCLKFPSNNNSLNVFDCKTSTHESRLLLKDSLSSCNIVDLELRLGQKRA